MGAARHRANSCRQGGISSLPRLGRCSARAEPEGAGAGRSTPRGGLCASRRNALAVGQQPLRIRIIPPLRGVKLARLELGARVSPHGHIRTARSVLDGEVLRSTALRLRGVFRAEPVDQYVQAQPTVEGTRGMVPRTIPSPRNWSVIVWPVLNWFPAVSVRGRPSLWKSAGMSFRVDAGWTTRAEYLVSGSIVHIHTTGGKGSQNLRYMYLAEQIRIYVYIQLYIQGMYIQG